MENLPRITKAGRKLIEDFNTFTSLSSQFDMEDEICELDGNEQWRIAQLLDEYEDGQDTLPELIETYGLKGVDLSKYLTFRTLRKHGKSKNI